MNHTAEKLRKQVLNSWKFRLFMLSKLPMGLLAGMRIKELDTRTCTTTVPYKYLTKNPFRSTYFAVQSMAAELSTATGCMLAVSGQKPSIAFIIVDLQAKFLKKATDRVYFTCNDVQNGFDAVKKCIESEDAHTAVFKTIGKMKDGTVVSEFTFTWSFKQRKS